MYHSLLSWKLPLMIIGGLVVLLILATIAWGGPANDGNVYTDGMAPEPHAERIVPTSVVPTSNESSMTAVPYDSTEIEPDYTLSWAKQPIENLITNGIVYVDADGHFQPNEPVTKADLAQWIVEGFRPAPVRDVTYADIDGVPGRRAIIAFGRAALFPDNVLPSTSPSQNAFLPDRRVSRGELLTTLVRALGIGELQTPVSELWDDVHFNQVHYHEIETATQLGLIPPYMAGWLEPETAATRAEAAYALHEALRLQRIRGIVRDIDAETSAVIIATGGASMTIPINADTTLFRNDVPSAVRAAQPDDSATIIADRFGSPLMVALTAPPQPTPAGSYAANESRGTRLDSADDDADKNNLQQLLAGMITPVDIQALLNGDWDLLKQSLAVKLVDELVDRGVTDTEALAIVEQNWDDIRTLGQERLEHSLNENTGLSEEVVNALLTGQWETVREQAEAITLNALSEWLLTDPVSNM